jgi:hypothetical protein
MHNIHEAQMFVNLVAAFKRQDFDLADDFDTIVQKLHAIAIERHCGNGYFSWDGIADDVAAMVGSEELAWEIVNEC